jgi:hypothetical protein
VTINNKNPLRSRALIRARSNRQSFGRIGDLEKAFGGSQAAIVMRARCYEMKSPDGCRTVTS